MTKCLCGCGQLTKDNRNRTKYLPGHNSKVNHPRKKEFYPLPSICLCGCGEIVWNGNEYVHGHNPPWHRGKKGVYSEVALRKMTKAKKGKHLSPETEFEKGQSSWNKGLTKETDEIVAKYGKKLMGHGFTEQTLRKISETKKGTHSSPKTEFKKGESRSPNTEFKEGHNTWNKGKTGLYSLPQETKNKISASLKGKPTWNKGRTGIFSEETRKNWSESRKGERHYNWKDGISYLPYCPKFNRELKEKIRERDHRTCQLCNAKEDGQKLDVHHVHYDKENCDPDLISLCMKCNRKVNFNRGYYEKLFINKLNERGLLFWTKNH